MNTVKITIVVLLIIALLTFNLCACSGDIGMIQRDEKNKPDHNSIVDTTNPDSNSEPTDSITNPDNTIPQETLPSQTEPLSTTPVPTDPTSTEPIHSEPVLSDPITTEPDEPVIIAPPATAEAYLAYYEMTADQQLTFINSFPSMDEFFAWHTAAKEAYESERTPIDGNTSLS